MCTRDIKASLNSFLVVDKLTLDAQIQPSLTCPETSATSKNQTLLCTVPWKSSSIILDCRNKIFMSETVGYSNTLKKKCT